MSRESKTGIAFSALADCPGVVDYRLSDFRHLLSDQHDPGTNVFTSVARATMHRYVFFHFNHFVYTLQRDWQPGTNM